MDRLYIGIVLDITDRKKAESEREITVNLLQLLNDKNNTRELIRALTGFLQQWSGCEAVGIRLREGEDFPYFETRGFLAEYVEAERTLCATDINGNLLRDNYGVPVLACMCGNVLRGRFNPKLPFFTERGTFWTNSTTELLASTTEEDRQARTRNRCNGEGYESVALVPLVYGKETIGLLQLNDHAKGRFTPQLIAFLESIADQMAIALMQRQAQASLEDGNERFLQLVNNIKDVFWIASVDMKKMIYVSPAYEEIWGLSIESLYNNATEWLDAVHPEDRGRVCKSARENRGAFNFSCEYRIVRPDGSIRWIEDHGFQVRHSQGHVYRMAGIAQDITERKQAEELLRESEERFRLLVDNAPTAIFVQTLGKFAYVNKAAVRLFGASSAVQLLGKAIMDRFHPDYHSAIQERIEVLNKKRKQVSLLEERCLRLDNTPFDVEVTAVPFRYENQNGALVFFNDITDRKKSEERLLRSEADLSEAQKVAKIGNWRLHVATNAITWSEELYRIFNIKKTEFSSYVAFLNLIHPDDRDLVLQTNKRAIESGESFTGEYRVVTGDGQLKHIREVGYAIKDDAGGVGSLFRTAQDITEQKEAEIEKKKLEERLIQAQKMEAVGQLSGGIAHDFNNILSVIMGNCYLLLMAMDKQDPQRELIDQIISSSEKAASLTKSLLAYSRKQVLEKSETNINEIIEGVQKLLGRLIGEDVDLQVKTTPEQLIGSIDSVQIEQVLMNMATNARDAMPKGGRLSIGSEKVIWDADIIREQGFGDPGVYCCITVSDTGHGMDKTTRDRIFDPFFTTKGVGKGTGLGLAMVHGIVKQHEGYITVASEVGNGSTFKIYLPLIKRVQGGKQKEIKDSKVPQGHGQTILLVEDDNAIRKVTTRMLKSNGYAVVQAVDGEDAVIKALEHRGNLDLIILDVIMPKQSGNEVYNKLRSIGFNTKVLFMSGYPADMISKNGVLQKDMHFLSKPASPEHLFKTIKTILNE